MIQKKRRRKYEKKVYDNDDALIAINAIYINDENVTFKTKQG